MNSKMNFVYMNEDSIDRLLKCKICSKPFIDPVITRDGDRFCRLCIVQSLVNTSTINLQSSFIENLISIEERILHDMLDNLLVKCPDCQQLNIRRKEFQQHLLTECPKRIVLCQACDLKCPWTGTYDQFDDHVKQCTFELLRPILSERIAANSEKNDIEQLKKQIEISENRTEKLQKSFEAFLIINSQQKLRYEKLQNDIQEIQDHILEQNTRQNELQNEIQQLKEQSTQIFTLLNEFQQSKDQLPNSNPSDNDIQQIKEQLNEYQLGIQQIQEHDNQIKQLQRQDLYRQNELLRIRQISDQHEVQIRLLARKKCVIPRSTTTTDSRIAEFIGTIPSNSEINLDGKNFDTQDMEFISKATIVDKQCRKLQIQNNTITAKGITLLADTLHGNTTLVELNLSNNCISDMGAHALAQVLSINNETLARLEISENNITDEGAEYLAEMLKTNKTLNLLGLNFNQISDRGVRHLASSITYYNETLQSLHLAFNKSITDASIDTLVDMLTHNRSLQELRLNDCSLTTDGKQKLKQIVQSNKHFVLQV